MLMNEAVTMRNSCSGKRIWWGVLGSSHDKYKFLGTCLLHMVVLSIGGEGHHEKL